MTWPRFLAPRHRMTAIDRRLMPLWALCASLLLPMSHTAAEPRLRSSEHPIGWSDAVLRLATPAERQVNQRRRNYTENCTATLVRGGGDPLLVTAWHCIEAQADLTQPPRVEINGDWYATRVIASGGSMSADWAILQVSAPPKGLPSPMTVGEQPLRVGDRVTIGGFSRDPHLGNGGEELTYHQGCAIEATQREGVVSNCLAYQGASGGPVIQQDDRGNSRLVGVISAGDSRSLSILVPVDRFRSRLLSLN